MPNGKNNTETPDLTSLQEGKNTIKPSDWIDDLLLPDDDTEKKGEKVIHDIMGKNKIPPEGPPSDSVGFPDINEKNKDEHMFLDPENPEKPNLQD